MFVFVFAIFLGGGLLYALLCTWLSRRVLRVLQVPDDFAGEKKRDRTITFVIYVSQCVPLLGVLVLLCTYIAGIRRHFRDMARADLAGRPRLPRVPQFALSELLVMAFSVGAYPLLAGGGAAQGGSGPIAAYMPMLMLVSAIVVFPLCFASAFLRLDGNKVPLGLTRLEFLFLYPYSLLSWNSLILTGWMMPLAMHSLAYFIRVWLVALLMIVLTYLVARRAKRDAEAASAAARAAATASAAQAAYGAEGELTQPTVGVTMDS